MHYIYIYVCIYVCLCAHICIHIYIYTHRHDSLHNRCHTHVYMHMSACVHRHVQSHLCTCTPIHYSSKLHMERSCQVYMDISLNEYIRIHIHRCTYACAHARVYINSYQYIHDPHCEVVDSKTTIAPRTPDSGFGSSHRTWTRESSFCQRYVPRRPPSGCCSSGSHHA